MKKADSIIILRRVIFVIDKNGEGLLHAADEAVDDALNPVESDGSDIILHNVSLTFHPYVKQCLWCIPHLISLFIMILNMVIII